MSSSVAELCSPLTLQGFSGRGKFLGPDLAAGESAAPPGHAGSFQVRISPSLGSDEEERRVGRRMERQHWDNGDPSSSHRGFHPRCPNGSRINPFPSSPRAPWAVCTSPRSTHQGPISHPGETTSTGWDDFRCLTSLTPLPALSHPGAYPDVQPSPSTRNPENTKEPLQSLQGLAAAQSPPDGL